MGGVDVGFDDAATLLDPEPHIPASPDVSTIPEDVDSPDVAEIAVDADGATPPIVAAVVGDEVPFAIANPPPSYVAGDPNVPMGEVAKVEQAPAPLLVLGTSIVPVTPLGTGLTGVDTPGAKPLAPTGALGSAPSEEVTPSGGMAVPTWANAGPQHNMAIANINNDLIGNPLFDRKDCAASGRKQRSRQDSGSGGFPFHGR